MWDNPEQLSNGFHVMVDGLIKVEHPRAVYDNDTAGNTATYIR